MFDCFLSTYYVVTSLRDAGNEFFSVTALRYACTVLLRFNFFEAVEKSVIYHRAFFYLACNGSEGTCDKNNKITLGESVAFF